MESRTKKLRNSHLQNAREPLVQANSGFALVMVLGIVVLLTVLVVAFFSNVTTELSSSQTAASGGAARRLSESTVQLVASQMIEATRSLDGSANRLAWASQPGMIRTYTDTGEASTFYKLYSSANMTVPGVAFTVAGELPPNNWNASPGLFTDLNSPITANGIVNFPIVDPRAKTTTSATSVEGFDYAASVNGVVQPAGSPDAQRLPMPALWLYQLQDGTMVAPNVAGSTGTTVAFPAVGGPTAQNPIVGRVAFWTDDDTNKVNINTASEGTYYDIPRYVGPPDYVLSMFPPVMGEYQRYPGHPATTSLSAVLKPWLPSPNDVTPTYDVTQSPPGLGRPSPRLSTATSTQIQQRLEAYLKLTPRFRFGGSQGATQMTSVQFGATLPTVSAKTDRLYSSVDELLYDPARGGTGLDKAVINTTRFFLTSNNRSPEVNLFGRPRVAIWPISSEKTNAFRTPQDRLIAFCSTIGDPNTSSNQYPFYFQRRDSKSTTADYLGIPRNPSLYAYLQNQTSQQIPGFGGSFTSKYGTTERNQILTEIFDYIRSCNLNDPNLPASGMFTDASTASGYWSPEDSPYASPGLVVPITISSTKGAGRYPVIDQAFLVFYTPETPVAPIPPATAETTRTKIRAALFFNLMYPMQGFMVCFTNVQFEVDAAGSVFKCEAVSNPDPKKSASLVAGSDGFFKFFADGAKVTQWANANERNTGQGNARNYGGNHGYAALAYHTLANSNPRKRFSLASQGIPEIQGDPALAKWNLVGGTFKVRILSDGGEEVQTYEFEFPDAPNLAIPTGIAVNTTSWPATPKYVNSGVDIVSGGLANGVRMITQEIADPSNDSQTISSGNVGPVVLALQLADKTITGEYVGGDFRRLAYVKNVPKGWYTPHKDYLSGVRMAHTLRDGNGNPLPGTQAGSFSGVLVSGVAPFGPYSPNLSPSVNNPYVRNEISGVFASKTGSPADAPGDWNNGFGGSPDGAYLNRADEGIAYSPTGDGEPYFNWDAKQQNPNLTSPNKQLPSAGMFGSLPTDTTRGASWQTLLFRPDYSGKHFGATRPPDYLMLDLFQMPIVEPYAISEPFSTAGKINMNYQIMPYSYITRNTGIRAVLASERILAIPSPTTGKLLHKSYDDRLTNPDYRFPINADETLKGFAARFTANDIFRSAGEICALDLVPKDTGAAFGSMGTYWNTRRMSGDNVLERPYTTIYPRLTTKSNTYTVHMRVQSLKKVSGTPANVWVEGKDQVTAEYRGSATLERYVDASDPTLPDFATNSSASLDGFYKFRILSTKRFAP